MVENFEARTFIREVEAAWNDRDPATILDRVSGTVEFKDPTMANEGHGTDAYREWLGGWFATLDDVSFDVQESAETEGVVAIRERIRGTHAGAIRLGGRSIPSTGETVNMDVAEFLTLDDEGKIARHHVFFDTLTLLGQLGVPLGLQTAPR